MTGVWGRRLGCRKVVRKWWDVWENFREEVERRRGVRRRMLRPVVVREVRWWSVVEMSIFGVVVVGSAGGGSGLDLGEQNLSRETVSIF